MSSATLDAVALQPSNVAKRVGVRLVDRGLVSTSELERISKAAEERKVDLSEVFISLGLLTEDQIAAAPEQVQGKTQLAAVIAFLQSLRTPPPPTTAAVTAEVKP